MTGSDDNEQEHAGGPMRAVVGLLLVVLVIAAVWFVMERLTAAGRMQDCLASGRTNCAPIQTN